MCFFVHHLALAWGLHAVWRRGFGGAGTWAWLGGALSVLAMTLLALGIYLFAPMTPAIFGPFVVARLAIGGWVLLFAALGWAPLHSDPRPSRPLATPAASGVRS